MQSSLTQNQPSLPATLFLHKFPDVLSNRVLHCNVRDHEYGNLPSICIILEVHESFPYSPNTIGRSSKARGHAHICGRARICACADTHSNWPGSFTEELIDDHVLGQLFCTIGVMDSWHSVFQTTRWLPPVEPLAAVLPWFARFGTNRTHGRWTPTVMPSH
jgi:hypothetical protein